MINYFYQNKFIKYILFENLSKYPVRFFATIAVLIIYKGFFEIYIKKGFPLRVNRSWRSSWKAFCLLCFECFGWCRIILFYIKVYWCLIRNLYFKYLCERVSVAPRRKTTICFYLKRLKKK